MSGIQSIRNSLTGNITKVIVVAIIITFIGSVGWAGFFSQGNVNSIARVGDQDITNADLSFELSSQQFALNERFPGQEIEDEILLNLSTEVLIGKFSVLDFLENSNLVLNDDFIYKQLSNEDQFVEGGRFSKDRFDAFARSNGFIPSDYLQRVREDLLINLWRQSIAASGIVTKSEILDSYQLAEQGRDISFIRIPAKKFREAVSYTEEQIESLYFENKDSYIDPAKAKVAYISIDAENLKKEIEVSDEEILLEYEEYLTSFDSTPRKSVSHIMLNLNDSRNLSDANELIDSIKQKIDKGENFSNLVNQYSEDEPTKALEGSLGETDGTMFPAEFEIALNSMKEGDVYGPIELLSSVHLIKLDQIIQPKPDSLETQSDAIRDQIASIKSEEEFVNLLDSYSDLAFGSDSIQDIAIQVSKSLTTTELFEKENTPDELNINSLKDFIFDRSVDNSFPEIVETSPLSAVLLQVVEFKDESQLALDDVRTEVEEAFISIETSKASQAFINEAITSLNNDVTLERLSKENDTYVETYKDLKRDSSLLPSQAVNEIFSLPRSKITSAYGSSVAQNGDYLLYRLDNVTQNKDQLDKETLESVGNFLEQQKSISELSELQALTQKGVAVERYN